MRKLIFLIALTLLSCSKEEENINSTDPIVGTWKPMGNVDKYEFNNFKENHFESSSCEQKSRVTFKVSGEVSSIGYDNVYEGNEVVACEIVESENKISFWRKVGDSYEFKEDREGGTFSTGDAERIVVIGDELRLIWYENEAKGEYDYELLVRVE